MAVKLNTLPGLGVEVSGTSPESVYRVIARAKEFAVACAVRGTKVSFRVEPAEGKSLEHIKFALIRLGFSKGGKQPEYWSMHMEVEDDFEAAKAVAAFLSGLVFLLGVESNSTLNYANCGRLARGELS